MHFLRQSSWPNPPKRPRPDAEDEVDGGCSNFGPLMKCTIATNISKARVTSHFLRCPLSLLCTFSKRASVTTLAWRYGEREEGERGT